MRVCCQLRPLRKKPTTTNKLKPKINNNKKSRDVHVITTLNIYAFRTVSASGVWMCSVREALRGPRVTLLGSGSVKTGSILNQQRTTVSDPRRGKMSTWWVVNSMQIRTVRYVTPRKLANTAETSAGTWQMTLKLVRPFGKVVWQ